VSEKPVSFDPVWEREIYACGRHLNRYPFDIVVSFVYRYRPREKPHGETTILEVGCGAANNLWFAAREGFRVSGVDASESAIAFARRRFAEDGLAADLRVGDFTALPFQDEVFDLVIDRGALTCCGYSDALRAISEIRRVLRTGGRFLFNPYSDRHSSRIAGRPGPDGLTLDISGGTLAGVGQLCFWRREQLDEACAPGWEVLSLQHLCVEELTEASAGTHAEWRVVLEKPSGV